MDTQNTQYTQISYVNLYPVGGCRRLFVANPGEEEQ